MRRYRGIYSASAVKLAMEVLGLAIRAFIARPEAGQRLYKNSRFDLGIAGSPP